MGRENFHASVQYNDSKGTAAADDHDSRKFSQYLQQQGLIRDGEMVVGIEMFSGEVHEFTQNKPIHVTALIAPIPGLDDLEATLRSGEPLHVRRIRLQMQINEFFGFFKRFQISISNRGALDGRDLVIADE